MKQNLSKRIVLGAYNKINKCIDSVPSEIRNGVVKSVEGLTAGIALAVPVFYAIANSKGSFLSRKN